MSGTTTDSFSGERVLGRVKWFNNRAGYGFISVLEGDKTGEDVFTHHSGISVDTEQYKYLVQGEYVEFQLRASDNEQHPYQAGNIRGVKGGMLMCETRMVMRRESSEQEGAKSYRKGPGRDRRVRRGGGGPRGDKNFDDSGSTRKWKASASNESNE